MLVDPQEPPPYRPGPPWSAKTSKRRGTFRSLQELLTTSGSLEDSDIWSRSCKRRLLLGVAIFCVVVTTAVFIISLLAWKGPMLSFLTHGGLCESAGCRDFVMSVGRQLNQTFNPCENFASFVCSNWRPEHTDSRSTLDNVRHRWFQRVLQTLEQSGRSVLLKANALYKACASDPREEEEETFGTLREFMDDRGMTWPRVLPKTLHPLDLLLDLAVNWNVNLWFRIRVVPRTATQPRRVYIISNAEASIWHDRLKHMEELGGYTRYSQQYFEWFHAALNTTSAHHLRSVESSILSSLKRIGRSRRFRPLVVRFQDIDSLTPAISSQLWLTFLNKHFQPTTWLTFEDEVGVKKRPLLKKISSFMRKYTEHDLLSHISWWFAQMFIPLAKASMRKTAPREEAPRICVAQVADLFQVPISVSYVQEILGPSSEENVKTLMGTIVSESVAFFTGSSLTDNTTRYAVAQKLSHLGINIWPPGKFCNYDALNDAYRVFPSNEKTYISYWIKSHVAYRAFLRDKSYYDLTRLPCTLHDPTYSYDYLSNTVNVGMHALMGPLFYLDGAVPVNYGGFGTRLAREVVKTFDVHGVSLSADGYINSWWYGKKVNSYKKAATCEKRRNLFSEFAAVQIAYQAMKNTAGSFRYARLEFMKKYSAEQLFFITYCYSKCGIMRSKSISSDCNAVLQRFQPFSDAFSCPMGSRMNPSRKCNPF